MTNKDGGSAGTLVTEIELLWDTLSRVDKEKQKVGSGGTQRIVTRTLDAEGNVLDVTTPNGRKYQYVRDGMTRRRFSAKSIDLKRSTGQESRGYGRSRGSCPS